jgi:hypothetical protein
MEALMKRISPWFVLFAALFLLISLSGPVFAQDDEQKEPCCYTNIAYTGFCSVTPTNDETCDSILQYLNTPGTVGKDYCSGSKIRGGWSKVACTTQDEPESKTADAGTSTACSSAVEN